jgi:putative endonuclease
MYCVYILECEDRSFYVGSSPDPRERFGRHRAGTGGRYTRSHKPTKIVYIEKFTTKSEALRREVQIKGWSKVKKENLIKFGIPKL